MPTEWSPVPTGPPRSTSIPPRARGGEPEDNFERVKAAVDIRDYLARFTDVQLNPRTLRGCCPIHKSSNPTTFSIDAERQTWRCFAERRGCGGGSIIDLHMALHTVSDWEAVREIAEAFGVELKRGPSHAQSSSTSAKDRMESDVVERFARHIYRLYCKDYLLGLPQQTEEERKRHREDSGELWDCALRVAGDLYRTGRDGEEVSADAS